MKNNYNCRNYSRKKSKKDFKVKGNLNMLYHYVCSKCETKDQLELSAFKDFMEENGLDYNSLNKVSDDTGISLSNLNRFLEYDGLEGYKKLFE